MNTRSEQPGRVTAKVRLGVTKIHGPESPDVVSGRVPLGHRELIQDDQTPLTTMELTYEQACQLWGDEAALAVFDKQEAERGNTGDSSVH